MKNDEMEYSIGTKRNVLLFQKKELERLRKENEALTRKIEEAEKCSESYRATLRLVSEESNKLAKSITDYKELVAWLNSRLLFKLIFGKITLCLILFISVSALYSCSNQNDEEYLMQISNHGVIQYHNE